MKRPAILGEDVAVVPREATIEMECRVDHEDCTTPDAAKSAFRDMLAASPHATAWAEVKAYVDGLEKELAAEKIRSVGDWANQRENDYLTIKRYEEKSRAEAAEARIAEIEKEKHAALTMIAMLEKRMADAERVSSIVPDARLDQLIGTGDPTSSEVHDMAVEILNRRRAARAYMEWK